MTTKCSLWKAAYVEGEEVMRRKTTAFRYVLLKRIPLAFDLQGFSEPLYVKIECDSILCLPGLDV